MHNYFKRKEFADKHLDKLKNLLGTINVREATQDEDRKLAIDFVTPFGGIAVRLRRDKWIQYADEWTLRGYGKKPEYAKLLDDDIPHADFYLYAWLSEDEKISKAFLVDLRIWKMELMKGKVKPIPSKNRDGKYMIAFKHNPLFSRQLV